MIQELMPCPSIETEFPDWCKRRAKYCRDAGDEYDAQMFDEAADIWRELNTRPTAQAVAVDDCPYCGMPVIRGDCQRCGYTKPHAQGDELIEAAKGVNALYPMHWDRVDGSAVIMPERIEEFEKRFARLQAALEGR